MSFLQKIVDIVTARQSTKDYLTEEYTGDIDENFLVTQFRGNIATAVLPTNGSGYSQAIRQGDWWRVTAAVTIGGVNLEIDDWLVAASDNPTSISNYFVKTSQTGITSGSLNIADAATGVLVIGTTANKSIDIDVVIERSSVAYSQKLNVLYDGTNLFLSKGTINPYIASNPTLGFVFGINLNGSNFELTYNNTTGLGVTDFNYKITKII